MTQDNEGPCISVYKKLDLLNMVAQILLLGGTASHTRIETKSISVLVYVMSPCCVVLTSYCELGLTAVPYRLPATLLDLLQLRYVFDVYKKNVWFE